MLLNLRYLSACYPSSPKQTSTSGLTLHFIICFIDWQALLAFCKTLIELSRYQRFICNFSAAAAERLTKRFPNYEVRIGSGLHVGWAIEGAIGSNRKIDASYLSPHVNFTEFLESSTKEYGVPLLFSEAFYRFLSPQAKKYCRQVGGMIIKSFSLLIFIMIDSQLSY